MFSLLLKELIFIVYLLSLHLVLCCVAALKAAPYIVHSAVYIFSFWSFEISGNMLRNRKIFICLDPCVLNMFSSFGPHLDLYQSFIGCFVETRNYSILSLAFIASSFRVTEENIVFETVQSGPYSSFECFLCS